MVPAGARARVLVLSALAALPAGAGPAGLPKQPLPKLLAATDARVASLAPPGALPRRQPPAATSRALVVARERRLSDFVDEGAGTPCAQEDYCCMCSCEYVGPQAYCDANHGGDCGKCSNGWTGASYNFMTATAYQQLAKLTAADAAASDYFGGSVAIDGDTIVVGAYRDDDGGSWSGSAYVFRTTAPRTARWPS